MRDVAVIAAGPHAVGTPNHDHVRDYLVDRLQSLGFEAHVQSATGFDNLDGPIAATVANVVGRKTGAHPGPAIVLMAHYDAVPRSYGAGDNAAAVAAILETARALQASPPLQHDVIVVFTDAEEQGLLGAEAFVDLHPWARDAAAVLNFDGRGVDGPVFMFQTSTGNAKLIAALAHGVADARTNSLTGEVYRHLPNSTDLSIWLQRRPDLPALNFAHIDGYPRYHTPLDNLTTLDPRVVQHLGDYALGMTRAFDAGELQSLHGPGDAIYFSAPLLGVMHYRVAWALPLSTLLLAGAGLLLFLAHRRRLATTAGVARSSAGMVAALIMPAVVVFGGWQLVSALHPQYREILQREPYNALWYLLTAASLTVILAVWIQRRAARRATILDALLPPLLLWSVAGLVLSILLPATSYLFAWPLLCAELAAAWWMRALRQGRAPGPAVVLLALPALSLWLPLIQSLESALTAGALPFCALLLSLVLVLLAWVHETLGWWRRPVALLLGVTAVVALVMAERTAEFSAVRKRPDSLVFLIDADAALAWWVSFDHTPDAWNAKSLGTSPDHPDLTRFRLLRADTPLLASPAAQPVDVPPSPVHVVAITPAAPGRRIHFHIDQSGTGEFVALYPEGRATIHDMQINGRKLRDGASGPFGADYLMVPGEDALRYYGVPAEGLDLWFTVESAAPVALRITTAIDGFPRRPDRPGPRPVTYMSKPFVATDMTIVERVIRL